MKKNTKTTTAKGTFTKEQIEVFEALHNTNDGATCFEEDSVLIEAARELEALGFTVCGDEHHTYVDVSLTEDGIKEYGKFNGSDEETIEQAVEYFNSFC